MFDPTVYAWALTAVRRGRRRTVVVDTDVTEVVPQALFHVPADVGVERLSARADHVMNRGPLLLDQGRDAGIAGDPLQAEQTLGAQNVGASLRRGPADVVRQPSFEPGRLGPQGLVLAIR